MTYRSITVPPNNGNLEPANYVEIVTYTILEIREICVYLFLGTREANFESG